MTDVLYVTDLDGPLLLDDATLSPVSKQILASLLAEGQPLTVASARSVVSMRRCWQVSACTPGDRVQLAPFSAT